MTHHTTVTETVQLSDFNKEAISNFLKNGVDHSIEIEVEVGLSEFEDQGYTIDAPVDIEHDDYDPQEINQLGINFHDWERLQALLLEKIKLHGVYATEQLLQP